MMNIYDIAKLAGVSIATVSRVVIDSPKVCAKTGEQALIWNRICAATAMTARCTAAAMKKRISSRRLS